jgi:hypothetical protein
MQTLVIKLVQNTTTHNMRKRIHNYLKNVPCKKRWHSTIASNNILSNVTKDNNILELQNLLEQNDFDGKPIKIFNDVMLIYATTKFNK